MRDLKADLERLDMQVERELALIKNMRFYAREQKEAKKLLTTYTALEIVTRRAWAEETRAIKAEALARELVEALRRYEEWEASLLLEDGVWERNAGLPVFTQELYDSWMEIQDVRNEALIKAEGVLGDE